MFELSATHYGEVMRHESALVCCMLLDRKLCRSLRVKPSEMVDPFWRSVLVELIADSWVSLRQVLERSQESHAARTIADAIRCPATGYDLCFVWNFNWHQSEIIRLANIRTQFMEAVDCILEHGEWTT